MKRVVTVVLILLAFAGGVWANEKHDIGSDAVSRISDVMDSTGSSAMSSVDSTKAELDSARAELIEIEESRNKEITRIVDLLNDNILVSEDSETGKKIIRRVCESLHSMIRSDKRMVELMRFIDEEDPAAAPATVTLKGWEAEFLKAEIITKTYTVDELEDSIADREWRLRVQC